MKTAFFKITISNQKKADEKQIKQSTITIKQKQMKNEKKKKYHKEKKKKKG